MGNTYNLYLTIFQLIEDKVQPFGKAIIALLHIISWFTLYYSYP